MIYKKLKGTIFQLRNAADTFAVFRSINYFADAEDQKYEKPLGMNDSGEKASDGALLIANYGKGKFVYTGLVFFRELPAGVPGALRLFVNLISK